MTLTLGEFQTPSGIDGYAQKFPDNEWERNPANLWPHISIEEVLSIQGLVMRAHNQLNRSKLSKPGRHGFAALNSLHTASDEFYDGSLEEYIAVRVAKRDRDLEDPESWRFDEWSMRIRFRQNELTEEQAKVSYLDEYMFSWLRKRGSSDAEDARLQAWYGNSAVFATSRGTVQEWKEVKPIDSEMIEELKARVETHLTHVAMSDALRASRRNIG